MKRFFQRAYHFLQRIIRESKNYIKNKKNFGAHIAGVIFKDGLIPPGKSENYLREMECYIDTALGDFINSYSFDITSIEKYPLTEKVPVWICWWQGEHAMPELVKMCYTRIQQILPQDKVELHLITLENYQQYVTFPEHIIDKFYQKKLTMVTLADILRMTLLSKYGGVWLDATIFFTGPFPEEFLEKPFYSQKMQGTEIAKREACKSMWSIFCMAGYSFNPIFHFVRDAFSEWWRKYDDSVEYLLCDYLMLEGYNHFPEIKELVDAVPNNNEDVFEMYKVLNEPYSQQLYEQLTRRNVIHKLTYKMELKKKTKDGRDTLYGHLLKEVYQDE